MPESYGVSTAESFRPVNWESVVEQLTGARNYWVATTRKSGRPHVSPVWGLYLEGRVTFATDTASAKARNIRRNPACSIHLESGDNVVIIDGTIRRVTDESSLELFDAEYETKYDLRPGAGGDEAPVYTLEPQVVLAWLETDFRSTATRWQLS
jgi:hypothetical protein